MSESPESLDSRLSLRLEALRQEDLLRKLRRIDSPQSTSVLCEGQQRINFSSNDYLGLAQHPLLKEAMIRGVEKWGVGSGASRLVCGSLAPLHELEEHIAAFKGTPAALAFSSGYSTAVGALMALLGGSDIVITDKLVHACVIDAVRASGAKLRVFKHNDMEDLERILQWAVKERGASKSHSAGDSSAPGLAPDPEAAILIVTESVFSMDGDLAPLRNLVELKERFGAWLMVDEAHGTGLYGDQRRGVIEAMGVSGQVEIQMGTLGKAIGAAGGYIAGSKTLIEWLLNRARSFVFSTAPPPAVAAAASAGISLIRGPEGEVRRQRLWSNVNRAKEALVGAGWPVPPAQSAILPCIVGAESAALSVSRQLWEQGILIPAIRYPTVARGKARLRLTLSADHSLEDIETLARCMPKNS